LRLPYRKWAALSREGKRPLTRAGPLADNIAMERILVVEDNRAMREMLRTVLSEKGYEVRTAGDAASAMLLLERESFAAVVSDLQLPDMDGLTLFKRIADRRIPFLILTAYGSIEKAVEAIKAGAFDFLSKPVDPDYLLLLIAKAIESTRLLRENIVLKEALAAGQRQVQIVGCSPGILEPAERAKQVAATDAPVLILGESGTGKELFARAIHNLSPRGQRPFLAVNSASIPENLLENELFGHERGSYTGAHLRQIGKLELAAGGTFFFDEIGDLPLSLQGKILRVIEEKKVSRLGSGETIGLDIRFLFATNQSLEKLVSENLFRRDLYYRINVFPIRIPPLRSRSEDIVMLAEYFIKRFAVEMKKGEMRLEDAAARKLLAYSWPGNVRELQNAIERAIIIARPPKITSRDIVLPEKPFSLAEEIDLGGSLKTASRQARGTAERIMIERALAECDGQPRRAAARLQISPRTLATKMRQHGLGAKR